MSIAHALFFCMLICWQVLILQFCQTSNQNRDMPRRGYPPQTGAQPPRNAQSASGSQSSSTHIELTRPHTLLLMSSVKGGTAFRGAYTGELAHQFRHADGKTSILDMHCKAVQRMNGGREWQVPEIRCTLTRGSLVFPKPSCTTNNWGNWLTWTYEWFL